MPGDNLYDSPLHEIAAGAGIVPGMAAVLSMSVSKQTIDKYKIPEFTPDDSLHYLNVTVNALKILSENLEKARSYLNLRRQQFLDTNALERLIL